LIGRIARWAVVFVAASRGRTAFVVVVGANFSLGEEKRKRKRKKEKKKRART
jgi:hypothetical protein